MHRFCYVCLESHLHAPTQVHVVDARRFEAGLPSVITGQFSANVVSWLNGTQT